MMEDKFAFALAVVAIVGMVLVVTVVAVGPAPPGHTVRCTEQPPTCEDMQVLACNVVRVECQIGGGRCSPVFGWECVGRPLEVGCAQFECPEGQHPRYSQELGTCTCALTPEPGGK